MDKLEKMWNRPIASALAELGSRDNGLSPEEVTAKLLKHGPNKLALVKPDGVIKIFLRQFRSPLIYILFGSAGVVLWLGDFTDAIVIFIVLLFNAIIGSVQEGRAQNTLAALKRFTETNATVCRDGEEMIIKDEEVVPGDIIILREGEKVPADARIIFSGFLKVDEAAMTGESEPVLKISEEIKGDYLPIADRKNIVFKGTYVTSGSGRALVFGTGTDTVIGRISKEISAVAAEIPLAREVRILSRFIVIIVVAMAIGLVALGVITGKGLEEMIVTAVSLSVSAIPEGLPIVMTLVLATGVWRMSKKKVLVKKLQAVETLGQAKVIAVDKTGTITKNEMVVRKIYADGRIFEVSGVGYEPVGGITVNGFDIEALDHEEVLTLGRIAAFSSGAHLAFSKDSGTWKVSGDPTEAAMMVFSEKIGFKKGILEQESPMVIDMPFDYRNKYHAAVHIFEEAPLLTIAGAPEVILSLSSGVFAEGKKKVLGERERKDIEDAILLMTREGLRVVAAGMKNVPKKSSGEDVTDLVFVGLYGIKDALRVDVKDSVSSALSAGMRVVMITGDHKETALSIAREAGIWKEGDRVLTGKDIDDMKGEDMSKAISDVTVFARVTPEHKLKIIQAYRSKGDIIAMTGDGINDAVSLVAADLGVAMGKIGTEVAKEAADIVLIDDNFGNIVLAIEEGRSIYRTIKKVILYLFSTSIGEILTIVGAIIIGFPVPILAGQIIWLNFVTDGFLDVSLAMEPKEKGLLRGVFRKRGKYLIDKTMVSRMILMGVTMMIGSLIVFGFYVDSGFVYASTMCLTALAVFQWFNAWNCRSETDSVFRTNPFSNPYLVGATAVVILLHFLAVYNPIMNDLLHTTPISFADLGVCILVASSILFVEEARKWARKRKK